MSIPNGKFVYLTNRSFPASPSGGRKMSAGGENTVAVYAIDRTSGEPTRSRTSTATACSCAPSAWILTGAF